VCVWWWGGGQQASGAPRTHLVTASSMLMPRMARMTPTWPLYCSASSSSAALQYELSLCPASSEEGGRSHGAAAGTRVSESRAHRLEGGRAADCCTPTGT
jgi:hypothetical protein